jgi:hypothetical protein
LYLPFSSVLCQKQFQFPLFSLLLMFFWPPFLFKHLFLIFEGQACFHSACPRLPWCNF